MNDVEVCPDCRFERHDCDCPQPDTSWKYQEELDALAREEWELELQRQAVVTLREREKEEASAKCRKESRRNWEARRLTVIKSLQLGGITLSNPDFLELTKADICLASDQLLLKIYERFSASDFKKYVDVTALIQELAIEPFLANELLKRLYDEELISKRYGFRDVLCSTEEGKELNKEAFDSSLAWDDKRVFVYMPFKGIETAQSFQRALSSGAS